MVAVCNCTNTPKDPISKVKRVIRHIKKIWSETEKSEEKNYNIKPIKGKKR